MSLIAIDLKEVSVVSLPANRRSKITGVKSLTSRVDLERGLRGEMPLNLSRGAAAKIAAVAWPVLTNSEPDDQGFPDELGGRIDATLLFLKSR